MKKSATIIGRIVIYLIGISIIIVLTVLLPELAREEAVGKVHPPSYYPYLIPWALSAPVFIALYQTHKLLDYIDKKSIFSNKSIKALQKIKYCAIAFGIMVVIGAASVVIPTRIVDPTEDSAPIGMFVIILTIVSSVIAIFITLLQKIVKDGIHIKSENDLTV